MKKDSSDEEKSEEIDDIAEVTAPRMPASRSGRRRVLSKGVKQPLAAELSEYEKIRAANIAEREEMLASLGIHSELNKVKQSRPIMTR